MENISLDDAKQIAIKALMSQGYLSEMNIYLDEIHARAEDEATDWSHKSEEFNLEGRDYYVINCLPKNPIIRDGHMFNYAGGEAWAFIDKLNGEVLGVIFR